MICRRNEQQIDYLSRFIDNEHWDQSDWGKHFEILNNCTSTFLKRSRALFGRRRDHFPCTARWLVTSFLEATSLRPSVTLLCPKAFQPLCSRFRLAMKRGKFAIHSRPWKHNCREAYLWTRSFQCRAHRTFPPNSSHVLSLRPVSIRGPICCRTKLYPDYHNKRALSIVQSSSEPPRMISRSWCQRPAGSPSSRERMTSSANENALVPPCPTTADEFYDWFL